MEKSTFLVSLFQLDSEYINEINKIGGCKKTASKQGAGRL